MAANGWRIRALLANNGRRNCCRAEHACFCAGDEGKREWIENQFQEVHNTGRSILQRNRYAIDPLSFMIMHA